ncbi:hypothetical protein DHEL01_v204608, partial [Diaporthe helianthi]
VLTSVTGANGGLGSAIVNKIVTSTELSAYHGLYTARSSTSALSAALAAAKGQHAHDVLTFDVASLSSVRRTAQNINARVAAGQIPPIRALVLNAGFQDFGKQQWTAEFEGGLDMTFATNYLGQWLLTLLLLGSMDKEAGRIVLIGSQSHDPYDKRNDATKAFEGDDKTILHDKDSIDTIAKGKWPSGADEPGFKGGYRRYSASKLFLVMMMHSLQARLNRDPALNKICILTVDPGTMSTGLQRHSAFFIRVVLFRVIFPLIAWLNPQGGIRTTERSAGDVVRAAFDIGPGLSEGPKDVYLDGDKPVETGVESQDVQKRDWVWQESVRLAGLKEGDTSLANWQ